MIPSTKTRSTTAPCALLLAVAGLALGACTADYGPGATAQPSISPTQTVTVSAPAGPARYEPYGTPTVRTVANHQAKQFDPFWIEQAADADRASWQSQFAGTSRHTVSPHPTRLLSHQTNELTGATGAPGIADGVEGLTHVTFASEGADFDPSVSRDGRWMVFASTQHRPTADIYIKSTTGRTITQLTADPANDVMPSVSPDGKRIAFASNRTGNWDVFVMSSSGGQAVQITGDPAQEVSPSWSPDGTKIVFSRFGEMSGRWEMWVTDVNSSASAEFVGYGLFPEFCPVAAAGTDGRDRILFQRSRERGDRAFSVWTVDYRPGDVSSPTEVASSQTAALINATWSPDGERIVFATIESPDKAGDPTVAQSNVSDLWMTNVDGSGRVNLTAGNFMNLMPAWSNDGRIYFVSDRGGVTNIWSMGTEKAIFAATGKTTRPTGPSHTEQATVPDDHAAPASGGH